MEIRPYQAGDEAAILDLFKTTFGRDLPLAFWRWRQVDNPSGGPWTELVWDGDRLAGHYAVSAANLCIDGNVVQACLSMTTMVHPDYRGQGIFEKSAESLYARLSAEGVKAVFGFPNNNSHRPFIQKLGWNDTYEIPTLSLDIPDRPARHENVWEIDGFDDRFDLFWAQIKTSRAIWAVRDRAALEWRFARNPVNAYKAAALFNGAELRGYAVFKAYGDGIDIVDLVAADPKDAPHLIGWLEAYARKNGFSRLSTWCAPTSPARRHFEAAGFIPGGPITYLGGRALADLDRDLSDVRNWHFSMSDSDVY